jgi:hypothetical protein
MVENERISGSHHPLITLKIKKGVNKGVLLVPNPNAKSLTSTKPHISCHKPVLTPGSLVAYLSLSS